MRSLGRVLSSPEARAYIALLRNGGLKGAPDVEPSEEPAPPQAADGGIWCASCLGVRWRRWDVAIGDPRFGALTRCPDCLDASRAIRRVRLAQRAGLSERQQSKTFGSFTFVDGARDAVLAASQFAVGALPTPWLVLWGRAGSGKSHLGLAAANLLVQECQPVRWFYVPDLLVVARARMRDKTIDGLLEEVGSEPVLILDEFGKARPDDYAVADFLEPLCDRRYRDGARTLFTLISAPSAVKADISESIGRRLEDTELCSVVWNRADQWNGRSE